MERARSEPRRLQGEEMVNPFWSQKLKDEVAIRMNRPKELPMDDQSLDDDDEDDLPPIRDASGTGKGRSDHATTSGASGSGGNFVTPPSRRSWRRAVGPVGAEEPRKHGRQTEGSMPADDPTVSNVQSMGRLPMSTEDDGLPENDDHDGLQRAMEREMFIQLQQQNARLMEELSRLKGRELRSTGSTGSWSAVTPEDSSKVTPTTRDESGGASPKRSSTSRPSEERFTPNGTRVPDGEPPGDNIQDVLVPLPPSLPPFPPPMPPMGEDKGWIDGYEAASGDRKVRRVDVQWQPSQWKAVSPREARRFWLEQEVQLLHNSRLIGCPSPKKLLRSNDLITGEQNSRVVDDKPGCPP